VPLLWGATPAYQKGLNGTLELDINVGDPENVDSSYQNVIDGGAKTIYPPRDEPWNLRSAMIADPDGNLIEIASDFWE